MNYQTFPILLLTLDSKCGVDYAAKASSSASTAGVN